MPNDMTLWTKLQALELDQAGSAFRFSDRLARENGWSRAFALGAIEEYRRFIYLAATSPTPVTPSDVVDQVWHLHLPSRLAVVLGACQMSVRWPRWRGLLFLQHPPYLCSVPFHFYFAVWWDMDFGPRC